MPDPERGPNVHELDSLRIARAGRSERGSRLIPTFVAVAAVAVLGTAGYAVYGRTLGRPPEVETALVTVKGAGQPGEMLSGSGYVITRAKYITIGTKILGQIMREPIEEGQHLKRGDLLAQIDDRDYKAQLEQAVADHQLALANLKLQQVKYGRAQALFAQSYLSHNDLDIAENAVAVASAEVSRTEAAIDYARFNVDQCTIRSPIDGVVLQKYREVGATINYGGDIQAGGGATDIVQLADTDDMRVEVDINESDIAKVSLGMPAQILADAYPDRTFDAKVVKIYPEANRQKGTVKVEVRFDKPDMKIVKPEMSAKVTFLAAMPTAREQPLVLLPKKAAVGATTGAASVWVVRDGIANRVPVVLGREFQGGLEVKQGLNGGELVIIVPPEHLKDGAAVTPHSS
ncbi:MAG: efflux RND transporter periplasmic adaptor subunit [Candidatus Binataceae bacterium]